MTSEVVDADGKNIRVLKYLHGRRETTVHIGPLPDPRTLRELNDIFPSAAKFIFEEFRAQSSHRREMEKTVLLNNGMLARRGQIIGATIAITGVVGGLVLGGLGHGWAGLGILLTSLSPLVTLFVYGREAQKKERLEKEETRQRINKGEPIEGLESHDMSPKARGKRIHKDANLRPTI